MYASCLAQPMLYGDLLRDPASMHGRCQPVRSHNVNCVLVAAVVCRVVLVFGLVAFSAFVLLPGH